MNIIPGNCGWGGHFGYAYVSAKCDSFALRAESCKQEVAVSAPDGFEYKWWPNKETTKDIIIRNAKPGDSVYVELTSVTGCKSSLWTKVYPSVIVPNFKLSDNEVCVNMPITFADLSTSYNTFNNTNLPIVDWIWDFGDSTLLSSASASHSYKTAGNYRVKLTVKGLGGCYDTISKPVIIRPLPIANFTWKDVCVNTEINFENVSKVAAPQSITSYTWTYDNKQEFIENALFAKYAQGGTYTINLAVKSTEDGCIHDATKEVIIWATPKANFSAKSVCINDTMKFLELSQVVDNGQTIPTWIWNFTDGAPLYNIKNAKHVFRIAGTYSVQLKVTTDKGCDDSTIVPVLVKEIPQPNFSVTASCLNQNSQFIDLTPKSDSITIWHWDFDDNGSVDVNQNSQHTYTLAAAYQPTLTVATDSGCEKSVSKPITIQPLPVVTFDSDKYSGCPKLCVNFIDNSYVLDFLDTIKVWNWNFGDNNSSNVQSPSYCYLSSGFYDVTLKVETKNTCENSFTWVKMIHVFDQPIANFEPSSYVTEEATPVFNFRNLSIVGDQYVWRFSDEDINPSVEINPSHAYENPGNYNVSLMVTSQFGCKDSITKQVIIRPSWTFYIPNAFSPDGTKGVNDTFGGVGTSISDYQLWIYNRWGEVIFQTKDISNQWTGKKNNSKEDTDLLKQDVYVWKVTFKDNRGKSHQRTGHVTLLR